ncbi:zinc-ribbon domain-containing protein [Saccharicrinis sp. FJH2]|uniref:zinc-ribbon domain-containing protein n=1 Tax=Saccharicrinis sp. FJH65 TaxID=3344659 RepID=UPI0035F2D207
MGKITCSNCGSENNNTNKYCSNCGYEIKKEKPGEVIVDKIEKPKSKRSKLVGSLVGVIAFFLAYYLVQYFFFPTPTLDKVLAKTANEINKTCPVMVDQFTQLDNVAAMPNNCFQYNYTLIENTINEVNLDTAAKYVRPNIINNVKTNPDLKYFRDNDVTLIYNYRDKNGVFVVKYDITPETYK